MQIRPLSSQYLREHQSLLMEFQNATHWPKHLLVHYTWKHTNPVDATGGLYLVFLLGMLPLKSTCFSLPLKPNCHCMLRSGDRLLNAQEL